MARIYKKDDSLKNKYRFYSRFVVIGGCLFAAGFLSIIINFIVAQVMAPLFIIGFICCFLGVVTISLFGGKASSLKVGLRGESDTAKLIERLPESYVGIQNVVVTFDGKQSELDMIVVGPGGVFVIEAKSRNGRIVGNYDSRYWTQHKVGRGGTPYSSDFYSPIKQVGTHVYRLANFLRLNGIRVTVEGAVYFSGAEEGFYISGTPGRIPVFTSTPEGINRLYGYITSESSKLSPQNVKSICELLLKG